MVDYYAQLDAEKTDPNVLNRREILRLNSLGAQVGFAFSVLEDRGLFRAGEEEAALDPKTAVPILTWPFLDYLDHLDVRGETLVELGAGQSTLWFAQRFGKIRSFETNPEWRSAVSKLAGDNVDISLIGRDELETASFEYRGEGWMLVDFAGKRTKFLHHFFAADSQQSKPAAVILDNSDAFRRGAAILQQRGYWEIPFFGFKSGQSWISCTSLFVDPPRFRALAKEPFCQPAYSRTMANAWDSI
jgi:hypothetical protein